jgi:hypothetical protein
VADEGDVGSGGLKRTAVVKSAEIAGIPGAAKERGKVTVLPPQGVEHAGKLLAEDEEPAVSCGILVSQGVDETVGGEATCGDTAGNPRVVDLGEETGDLTPTCSFAGFA